ncbi:MAG: aspartate kinase [Muribaculaceae bacterium]|nr:aspartate kinase [Muribaculaceae bacterium]
MKVLKFGGTSVGTPASLRNVKKIVEGCDEQVIVVVSALGGITDQLINTARLASQGDMTYLQTYAAIVERHINVIEEVVVAESKAQVKAKVNSLFEELGNIFWAICLLRDLSDRTMDMVVSFGERLSSVIISKMIADCRYFYSPEFIVTQNQFGKHILDNEETTIRIHETFDGAEFKSAIVPGFISTDRNGDITNLGRGGSDYTASILAAVLNADILEIWTDVDGFMTADPRIVKNAYVMDHMTFAEAMELCNFGAKVIYPPTLYPVYHKNISIKVKNTFNYEAPGTLISATSVSTSGQSELRGLSYIREISLVKFICDSSDDIQGLSERIFNALAKSGIGILLVDKALRIALKSADAKLASEVLIREFSSELRNGLLKEIALQEGLSLVAVVGNHISQNSSIFRNISEALDKEGCHVYAHNSGSADTNISVVVAKEEMESALISIHSRLFE